MDRTYRMRQDGHVRGFCTGLEAVKQSIWKMLNTQQGQHLIYGSSGYGLDWEALRAALEDSKHSEVEQILTSALMKDERIQQVEEIQCVQQQDAIWLSFGVVCSYGNFWVEEVKAYV